MTAPLESLLHRYQDKEFNPVPIALKDEGAWESHFAKRRNLYERHLGIPLSLLRGRSVIEFGCNSGENALVLASVGANLTLVEPNEQVIPRLRDLFKHFKLEQQIVALVQQGMDEFVSESQYDLVIAEGFVGALPDRDQLVEKMVDLLVPGGLGIISFNDRYGGLLEMVRRLILWRACQMAGISDPDSQASLELARRIYGEDFANLHASRPFEAWWKDGLVSPFISWEYLWSYPELLPLIEKTGCDFYSASPKWDSPDHFEWYKKVPDGGQRHATILDEWSAALPYLISGLPNVGRRSQHGATGLDDREAADAVASIVERSSEYMQDLSAPGEPVRYPPALDRYLAGQQDPTLSSLNGELRKIFEVMESGKLEALVVAYLGTTHLRNLWGTAYHYLCFTNRLDTDPSGQESQGSHAESDPTEQ